MELQSRNLFLQYFLKNTLHFAVYVCNFFNINENFWYEYFYIFSNISSVNMKNTAVQPFRWTRDNGVLR